MYAYESDLLDKAQNSLGWMLTYGVKDFGLKLEVFYQYFLNSSLAERFERGDSGVLCGMSGTEMAMEIIKGIDSNADLPTPSFELNRSPVFWTGWALAFYQWESGLSFREITEVTPIASVCLMYQKYHEMDIRRFVDAMNGKRADHFKESRLKRLRAYAGLSQKELAEKTEIPIRTIQQYEQGQKDIRKANAVYLLKLSKALYCNVEDLLIS